MRCLLELGVVDGIAMTFLNSCHLVVGDSIELIVCDRCHLCLELVKTDCDILIIKCLEWDWIGRIVDQYVWVNTHLHKMDYIVIHDT